MKRFGIGAKQLVLSVLAGVLCVAMAGGARADSGDYVRVSSPASYSLVGMWTSHTIDQDGQDYVLCMAFDNDGNFALARCRMGTQDVQTMNGTYIYANGLMIASFGGQVQTYRVNWTGPSQFVNGSDVWNRM